MLALKYDIWYAYFLLKQVDIFPAPFRPCRPRISVTHCASLEVPLDPLFAVDQKANLYGKNAQPAELTFGQLVNKSTHLV